MNLFLVLLFGIVQKYEIICENKSKVIQSESIDGQDYLPLRPIAEVCGINYALDMTKQRCILSTPEHSMTFIGGISLIKCDGIFLNLSFVPHYLDGEIYFPVALVTSIIGGTFERLIFLKKIEEIPIINSIKVLTKGDSTIIRFSWKEPIEFDVLFSPQRTIIEIDGKYDNNKKIKPKGAIKSVDLFSYKRYTRIELSLENINTYLERDDEIVFYNKRIERVQLIVLDPGHGGIDVGAVGKKGLYEKDVTLDISRRLKKLIDDSLKIRTLLTRDKDQYLSLKARTDFANRNGADIFISIHCNASPKNKMARGFETYFLSEARTTEERAVEAMENASLMFDDEEIKPCGDLNFIFYDLAQTLFLEESNNLAEAIQSTAEKKLNIPTRGVNQAGFYVLRGAFMPSVLVEVAFISNPEEEELLRKKEFKELLAYTIFCGLKDFIKNYERRLNY